MYSYFAPGLLYSRLRHNFSITVTKAFFEYSLKWRVCTPNQVVGTDNRPEVRVYDYSSTKTVIFTYFLNQKVFKRSFSFLRVFLQNSVE